MSKFVITGIKTESVTQEIKAKDRVEAAKHFKNKYPDYVFDYVGGDMILGWCENSGNPIFKGDEYETDENGIMWLK